jgi:hypothetical protein
MSKYRGWVAKVEDMEEFDTREEARAWAMAARDKAKAENPKGDFYFEVDDCGAEDEEGLV